MRRRKRAFVEIIEFAADWNAVGQARHLQVESGEPVHDVMRGGLALDGGVDRQNDFAHAACGDAGDQLIDAEIVRADAIERRQRAAEHVVAGVQDVGALQRPQVGDVLDHDDQPVVAARIGADGAGVGGIDVAAGRADHDRLHRHVHGLGQRHQQFVLLLDQMQRGAAGRARPQARQLGKKLDQALDLWAGDGTGHEIG